MCRGSLGAVTVDNLRVPSGATCTLNRTVLKGTVKVESSATLRATAIRVVGNIQAEGHRHVAVSSSTVGGSIQLKQGGSASIGSNRVTGDVQSFTNRGAQNISRNRINGNLQCKSNVPAPTGGGNVVGGNKQDRCRGCEEPPDERLFAAGTPPWSPLRPCPLDVTRVVPPPARVTSRPVDVFRPGSAVVTGFRPTRGVSGKRR